MNYQLPKELLDQLILLFPEFKDEWDDENAYIDVNGEFSLHSIYMTFLPFLTANIGKIHHGQIQQFAALINEAVDAGGDSENAVSTCILEHLGQVKLYSILKPLLSEESLKRLHA